MEKNFLTDFLVGGVSAAVSKTIVAPIERVKLLLQVQDAMAKKSDTATMKKYEGIMDCARRVSSEQGNAAFWRGNFANVLRYFPTQALNFAFKDLYKNIFCPYNPKKEPVKFFIGNCASGGAAGATSLLVVYPLDFARTRLAMDVGTGADREFNGTFDTILKTAKTSGWFKGGVYNGFAISCVGIIIYRGAYFGIYDSTRAQIEQYGFWGKFLLGYAVTTVAGLAAYPIDTVRRRMMMNSGLAKEDQKYKSSIQAFGLILKEEGVAAYFRGASANIFRGLGGTLVLVGFDYFKDFYIQFKYGK